MGMAGWASQGRDDILCGEEGGGLVVAPSSCLLWLSLALSCEHITTLTNKPCHLETPALVTMLSGSTTGAAHRHSPIRPNTCTHTHTKKHCVNTILHIHKTSDPQSEKYFTGRCVAFPWEQAEDRKDKGMSSASTCSLSLPQPSSSLHWRTFNTQSITSWGWRSQSQRNDWYIRKSFREIDRQTDGQIDRWIGNKEYKWY